MSSKEKGLASLSFPPLMYGALAIVFGVVMTSFILGPSGMGQVQSAVMDILGLLDVIAGIDQAAIDSALATSYAMSCTSLMNLQTPHNTIANAYAGDPEYFDAGEQILAEERITQAWNESATPLIQQSCNESTTGDPVSFGNTGVNVTCDDFERGGGCDIHGFTLPQKNIRGSWVEWILGRGHPEHILYYQALPSGVDESWKNLGEKYNAMGVAIGAGVSVLTPSIMKVGKGLLKGGTSLTGAMRNAASYMATARKTVPNKAHFIASRAAYRSGQGAAAISNPRQAARYVARVSSNYVRSQGARAMRSYHKIFAEDLTSYATAYAKNDYDDITQEMVEDAVEQTTRNMRDRGYRNLDQQRIKEAIESNLARTDLGDEMLDEGIEEVSQLLARRWVGASRETVEYFSDQATQQAARRSASLSDAESFAFQFRQLEFQNQAFKRIEMVERVLGQSSEEIMESVPMSAKGDVFESIFGKGIATVKHVANPGNLKRKGIRAACSSKMFRVGMFEGVVGLMDSADNIAEDHDGISEAYAEDMQRLKEGDVESESGLNYPEGLGHCLAYSGLSPSAASSRMCGRVGVNAPSRLGNNLHAQHNGVSACAAITMAGITADKMMTTRQPFMPQATNSIQLFNPVHGRMEFPLNRFANFHFMTINKEGGGITSQTKERFYLISPVKTAEDNLNADQAATVEVRPGGVGQRISGKQRGVKNDGDICNAVDAFKEYAKENIEEAVTIAMLPMGATTGLLAFMALGHFDGGLPNIIEGQDIEISREEAINEYNHKGSFLETGLCPNNIMFTDLPIVGKEVIMDNEYEWQDSIYQEEMQSLENADYRVTAPPGFEEAYPSQSTGVQNITDDEQLEEEGGDFTYKWSSAMPMVQPVDMGQATDEFRQVGDWLRPYELDDHDVRPMEIADVGLVLVQATETMIDQYEWCQSVSVPHLGSANICFPPIDVPPDIQLPQLSTDAYTIDASEADDGEWDVDDVSLDFGENWEIGGDPLVRLWANGDVVDCSCCDPPSCSLDIDIGGGVDVGADIANNDRDDADWTSTIDAPSFDASGWFQGAEINLRDPETESHVDGDLVWDIGIPDWDVVDEQCLIDGEYGISEASIEVTTACIPDVTIDTPGDDLTWSIQFRLNTGWVPREYISQYGEGVEDYRPPPGIGGGSIIEGAIELVDSDRSLNYFVNGLDVTLDTPPGSYQDAEGNPLFGYDKASGEGGSLAIYFIGGITEMIVTAAISACTATVVGSAVCWPLGGLILAGIGGLTELAAQSYKDGCNWPVQGCNSGLVDSTIQGAKVGVGATATAAEVAVDAAGSPEEAVGATWSVMVDIKVAALNYGKDMIDWAFDTVFGQDSDENDETGISDKPGYDGPVEEPPIEDPEE